MNKVSDKIETKVKANGNGKAADASAEVKNAETVGNVKPTVDELRKQIEEQIARFQRKSELIAQRDKFIETKAELVENLKKMGTDFDDNLESPNLKIVLVEKDQRYNEGISISNNELVFEFIRMLLQKVMEKIQKLEAEIVS